MSRVEVHLGELKQSLEKALSQDAADDTILDILTALRKIPISIELLRSTKIGQVLQDVKKQRFEKESGTQARQLISKWKQDCAAGSAPKSEDKGVACAPTGSACEAIASKSAKSLDGSDGYEDDLMLSQLSDTRKQIVLKLAEVFLPHVPDSNISKFLGVSVENALNTLHSEASNRKAYMAKAMSIKFNLGKNERLCRDIVSGMVSAEQLTHMSAKELATDEVRDAREETTKTATLARRSDLYEITRSEILSSNGIDPNKGGEFVCRKCKGTKTTHYALQTRSSDEPMTVFVCCLNCGNRWRTQ